MNLFNRQRFCEILFLKTALKRLSKASRFVIGFSWIFHPRNCFRCQSQTAILMLKPTAVKNCWKSSTPHKDFFFGDFAWNLFVWSDLCSWLNVIWFRKAHKTLLRVYFVVVKLKSRNCQSLGYRFCMENLKTILEVKTKDYRKKAKQQRMSLKVTTIGNKRMGLFWWRS